MGAKNKAGRTRKILIAATIVAAIVAAGALERQSPCTSTELRHGLQGYKHWCVLCCFERET
jgi:hypothetical protein